MANTPNNNQGFNNQGFFFGQKQLIQNKINPDLEKFRAELYRVAEEQRKISFQLEEFSKNLNEKIEKDEEKLRLMDLEDEADEIEDSFVNEEVAKALKSIQEDKEKFRKQIQDCDALLLSREKRIIENGEKQRFKNEIKSLEREHQYQENILNSQQTEENSAFISNYSENSPFLEFRASVQRESVHINNILNILSSIFSKLKALPDSVVESIEKITSRMPFFHGDQSGSQQDRAFHADDTQTQRCQNSGMKF